MFMGNVFSIIALYSILTCAEIILSIKFDYPSSNATQFWRGGEEVNVPSVGGSGENRQSMYPDAQHISFIAFGGGRRGKSAINVSRRWTHIFR